MAKHLKKCDKCDRVYLTPTARRNCLMSGCSGSLKKYEHTHECSYCAKAFTPEFDGQPNYCSAACYEASQE